MAYKYKCLRSAISTGPYHTIPISIPAYHFFGKHKVQIATVFAHAAHSTVTLVECVKNCSVIKLNFHWLIIIWAIPYVWTSVLPSFRLGVYNAPTSALQTRRHTPYRQASTYSKCNCVSSRSNAAFDATHRGTFAITTTDAVTQLYK